MLTFILYVVYITYYLVKYFWYTKHYYCEQPFSDVELCKVDMMNFLQDLVNKQGTPMMFKTNITQGDRHTNNSDYNIQIIPYKYNDIDLVSSRVYIKPNNNTSPPKFRYIDYKKRWCVYGHETNDTILKVFSTTGLPNNVKRGKLVTRMRSNYNEFGKVIYEIDGKQPNTINGNLVQINDNRVYHPGDKISVINKNKKETCIVKDVVGLNASILRNYKPTHMNNKYKISILYNNKDHHIVNQLSDHLKKIRCDITYFNTKPNEPWIDMFSINLNEDYINDAILILYTKNSINDPLFNQRIGKIMTLDLPFIAMHFGVPSSGQVWFDNFSINCSYPLYPEEVNELISLIKYRRMNFSNVGYILCRLLSGQISNSHIPLLRHNTMLDAHEILSLIYYRYNNEHIQNNQTLKLLDGIINDFKSILPKKLYNMAISHAKTKSANSVSFKKKMNNNVKNLSKDTSNYRYTYDYQKDVYTLSKQV